MSQLQTHLIAAAIGATIGVISAASIFIYQKVLEKQQHAMKNAHLDEVDRRLTELQTELERLRVQQGQQRKKKISRKHDNDNTLTAVTDNDTDGFSTAATDIGDDEFFDCSDSENNISDIERTTEATYLGLDLYTFDVHHHQEGHEEDDYLELRNYTDSYPDNVDVVWRYARSCYKYSNCIPDPNAKKNIICAGINACEKLLTISDAYLHKWYAILVGVYGEFLPISERIKNGYRFKEHVMKALEIRPDDADLHHLLGRFRYEVANLGWIERKVATTLFSEPPSASFEDAIDSFQKAENFSVEVNLENRLFLSKCYIALSKYELACDWLNKICDLSVASKDDEKTQSEAHQLLLKYSGYQ
ncbi:regulator of microtubule dynamics protein 1-like [Nylanderia fulva]|uniref:regulator of microtubule dynamics protein 1-like n=1 Tax=Nylanderia fulva TaxID=613905 RepID=UPI0010FAE19A|nr:regulator of microtubule dynamics protein 1-like [Nylanderia fulva]XP_029164182.1 regulator of microtubule dynamics protein 1-like [Nylanderia fulva]